MGYGEESTAGHLRAGHRLCTTGEPRLAPAPPPSLLPPGQHTWDMGLRGQVGSKACDSCFSASSSGHGWQSPVGSWVVVAMCGWGEAGGLANSFVWLHNGRMLLNKTLSVLTC